jgi:hypothetical protein
MRELHPIAKETATRTEKHRIGDTLEIDSRVELVSTMEIFTQSNERVAGRANA